MGCDQTGDLDGDDDQDDDNNDDDEGEGRVEDKMGCDQTGDLDGAFVPPLSDHPCLQCPALSSTNRTQPNHISPYCLQYYTNKVNSTMSGPVYKPYTTKPYKNKPYRTKPYYSCLQ